MCLNSLRTQWENVLGNLTRSLNGGRKNEIYFSWRTDREERGKKRHTSQQVASYKLEIKQLGSQGRLLKSPPVNQTLKLQYEGASCQLGRFGLVTTEEATPFSVLLLQFNIENCLIFSQAIGA